MNKDFVLSAVVGDNGELFSKVFPLYVQSGSLVFDATYGKGVFWKKIDEHCYRIVKNDIDVCRGGVHYDFRCTPYTDGFFDAHVFDPPYGKRSSSKAGVLAKMYNNEFHELNTVEDMIKFYYDGMLEAYRILKDRGILFVKCQDEISGGKQRRNHIDIWKHALEIGFLDEDLFVLVQDHAPIMRHSYQLHSRKNNSFLWVFRKVRG